MGSGVEPSEREILLNALYASVSEVPSWLSFTKIARDMFDCDQVAVMIETAGQDMPTGAYADEALCGPIDALFAKKKPEFIEDSPYLCATDTGCALILTVVENADQIVSIVLWKAGAEASFGEEVHRLLGSLAGPLRRSMRIFYRIVDLSRSGRMNEIALETSRIGVAALSIDGELLLSNSIMDQILKTGDGLHLIGKRIHANDTEASRELQEEIRRCALNQSADNDPRLYTPMAFPRIDSALPLTAILRPGGGFYPLRRPLRRTAIMIVRDPAMEAAWPAQTVARLFGLSAAEAQLASQLAKGASLDEAAKSLGVSRNTARTQLQSVFLKTGTNRQSDLIRTLLNSAAGSI